MLLKITDDAGNLIGGCIVEIDRWKTAALDTLRVDEKNRRQGLGSALIREAERAAGEKGCHVMLPGTFDFQARPLYEKHGYELCSTFSDFPRGHKLYDFLKRLDHPAKGYVPSVEYEIRPAVRKMQRSYAVG
ncbi:MAG: GNAT family N-acetyltransferase [Solobacterium sp.]|nr:GNAT family N-acetyltransferase [Solobacterium sp.]